jgi:hypothetical protein
VIQIVNERERKREKNVIENKKLMYNVCMPNCYITKLMIINNNNKKKDCHRDRDRDR